MKEGLHFARQSSLESSEDSIMFSIGFTSCIIFVLYSLSITILFLVHNFDALLSNMDKIVSVNSPTNVFSLAEINIYYKEWVTYSGELYCNL